MAGKTTISIDKDLRDKIGSKGRYGESLNDIIRRIFNEWEETIEK